MRRGCRLWLRGALPAELSSALGCIESEYAQTAEAAREGVLNDPVLLLVDQTRYSARSEVLDALAERCVVHVAGDGQLIAESIHQVRPHVLCFEYDYPDISGLSLLQETKVNHPSIPILMVTEQSSEALAIWAFRSRVWDYYSKPVSTQQLFYCIDTLHALSERRHAENARGIYMLPQSFPQEARVRCGVETHAVDKAVSFVERHLDEKIEQRSVAKLCGMDPYRFSRSFKRTHGVTFQEFVIRRRMTEAVRLLQHPGANVTDVCYAVGFNDLSYFTRTFRRYVGTTPSRYKRELERAHASLLHNVTVDTRSAQQSTAQPQKVASEG